MGGLDDAGLRDLLGHYKDDRGYRVNADLTFPFLRSFDSDVMHLLNEVRKVSGWAEMKSMAKTLSDEEIFRGGQLADLDTDEFPNLSPESLELAKVARQDHMQERTKAEEE